MISVAVNGSSGRVGRLIVDEINRDPTLSLGSLDQSIDVLIDFSAPVSTLECLDICVAQKYPMVIGTTGFSELEKVKIEHAAQSIPIVFSPNMSIGINISYKLLDLAANLLKKHISLPLAVSITDIHHQHKKDAPSGTALRMAEVIRHANADVIELSSVRSGETIGEHSALFQLAGEEISIIHKANDRALYAAGALKAAKWINNQPPGLYDMQDVLQLKR
jgi:4-hydroxy-tetrahydrodipicolinate reductase